MQNEPCSHVPPKSNRTGSDVVKLFVDPREYSYAEYIHTRKPCVFRKEPLEWDCKWPTLKAKYIGK